MVARTHPLSYACFRDRGARNTTEKHLYVLNTKPNKELTDKPLSDNSIVFRS